jgi:hypothetical protein
MQRILFSIRIASTADLLQRADIDWVHEILSLVQSQTFTSSVVGDSQELVEKYEKYKRDVLKSIQILPGPDPTIVAAMIAIQYLIDT